MAITIGRREFITLLGGAAWPLAARAQRPAIPAVGFLYPGSARNGAMHVAAFRAGLREAGFVEGQNVTVEYRFADNQFDRLPALLAELVRRRGAVIVGGSRVGEAAKAAKVTIPIVFSTGRDPVAAGLVTSINRPGGNLTGVSLLSPDLTAKRLGLLHDLVPQATTIAMLADSTSQTIEYQLQEIQSAARSIGLSIRVVRVGNEREFDAAFATMAAERPGALFVSTGNYFVNLRERLTALAARHGIPAIYELRDFAEAGGLMTYGPSENDAMRQVGVYTGRILKGAKPADLPVVLPTKYELVINLNAAKALGLAIPPQVLAIADEVIE